MDDEPTPEGKERHPPNGYYDEAEEGHRYPCTCTPSCANPCGGDCGCQACHVAYMDFLSMPDE